MIDILNNNAWITFAVVLFGLATISLMFVYTAYIPHFLVAVYFSIPIVYKYMNIQRLPLTTLFVLLFGPVILWRSRKISVGVYWPIGVYIFIVILMSLLNDIPMWDNRVATFMPLTVAVLCAVSMASSELPSKLERFTDIIIIWAVANACFSILQLAAGNQYYLITAKEGTSVLGVQRGYGLIGMATQVGAFFCLAVPLIASNLIRGRSKRLLYIVLPLGFAGLVLSFSRGAIVGVLVSMLILLVLFKRWKTLTVCVIACGFVLVSYAGIMVFLPKNYSYFLQGRDGSAKSRLPFTQVGLRMFADRPLTGFGLGGFYEHCTRYGSPVHIEAHNSYLQVLVEYGFLGFSLFLFVIVRSVMSYVRYMRHGESPELRGIAAGYLCSLVAVLIDALVHCFEWNMALWIPIALGYMFRALGPGVKRIAPDCAPPPRKRPILRMKARPS